MWCDQDEYLTWSQWFEEYKHWAGIYNPKLAAAQNGKSLIDFMELTPVKTGFHHRIHPVFLARNLAETFDPATFGQSADETQTHGSPQPG